MKIFFSVDYIGVHRERDIVSIGMISEDGREFYAELNDYNDENIEGWEDEVVLDNLKYDSSVEYYIRSKVSEDISVDNKWNIQMRGNRDELELELRDWLSQFNRVQLISDVGYFDFTLLVDLFGSMKELPVNMASCCHDINQDIAEYLRVSDRDAYSVDRINFINNHGDVDIEEVEKSNVLYEARVVKKCYEIVSYAF